MSHPRFHSATHETAKNILLKKSSCQQFDFFPGASSSTSYPRKKTHPISSLIIPSKFCTPVASALLQHLLRFHMGRLQGSWQEIGELNLVILQDGEKKTRRWEYTLWCPKNSQVEQKIQLQFFRYKKNVPSFFSMFRPGARETLTPIDTWFFSTFQLLAAGLVRVQGIKDDISFLGLAAIFSGVVFTCKNGRIGMIARWCVYICIYKLCVRCLYKL